MDEAGTTGDHGGGQEGSQGSAHGRQPRPWEAAVGRGADCLKANARRYRVVARNAARAALQALHRHRIGLVQALNAELHIALYDPEHAAESPRAVFRIAGSHKSPELHLCYARLQESAAALQAQGGPLDRESVQSEMPHAARRRAESQLGLHGLRAVLTEHFWQREITLYTGTAMFLAALGFPMTPGVFVVGAVLLLIQGAVRLAIHESRIRLLRRRIVRDETLHPALHTAAVRALFARSVGIAPEQLETQLAHTVLGGQVVVPDLGGEHALRLYVDEEARIAAGALRPAWRTEGGRELAPEIAPEDLTASENELTIVFRRPKRVRLNPDAQSETDAGAQSAESAPAGQPAKVDIDDIGEKSKVPAKVDLDELGGAKRRRAGVSDSGDGQDGSDDDVEVVEAEVIPPEEFFKPGGGGTRA